MNIDIKTADGAEVELGGVYYDGRGTEYRAVGVRLVDYRRITDVSLSCLTGKVDDLCCVSMRPNELYLDCPDSLEKLRDDLDRFVPNGTICSYLNRENRDCDGCKFEDHFFCFDAFARDVTARVHRLCGDGK